MTSHIVGLDTPLELPAASPIRVRAAAIACVYAIEDLAFRIKESNVDYDDNDPAKAADKVVTEQRRIFEGAGWKLLGVGEIADGTRGWKLVAA